MPSLPESSSAGDAELNPAQASSADVGLPGTDDFRGMAADSAWQLRENAMARVAQLPAGSQEQARQAIDGAVEAAFPGLIDERTAPEPAPEPAPFDPSVCPTTARACVDLDGGHSWLQDNGQVAYGPVASSAGPETPRGRFTVVKKVRDEVSAEFGNAPMPYSVYFTNNGMAFHEGEVGVPSAGCVHLNGPDARAFFDSLQVGDEVYIF